MSKKVHQQKVTPFMKHKINVSVFGISVLLSVIKFTFVFELTDIGHLGYPGVVRPV